jgi:hypothetical protein
MSNEAKHYWASGMRPEQAQKYLLDLCGSESQNYTENPEEVTCERCVAALRAGRGASGTRPQEEAASPPPAPVPVAVDPNGVLDREVRAAVLKEREDIIEFVQGMLTLDGVSLNSRVLLRQLVVDIRKRP